MTTINTSDDLIRVLRDDPELRATIRQELLTADLQEVPARLTSMEQGVAALFYRLDSADLRPPEPR